MERVEPEVGGLAAALDDTELMIRVKHGHEPSFGILLEKHRAPLVHFLYRMVQNGAVAEELAQEVFLRVYRSRSTYARGRAGSGSPGPRWTSGRLPAARRSRRTPRSAAGPGAPGAVWP
jgi:hypothetical protein